MADEQKTTTPDRATYTSLNLGRESVDRHPSQQPETLYSSPAQRAALLRTCGGAAILLGIVISLVASAAMVATAPPPVGTVRFGLPQPQAKRSVAGRLRQRLVVDVGTDNFGVVARRYGATAPAPTLLVEPGDTLTVDVQNKLGPEAPGDALMTGLHRPNTTSLHVHGWHVSPREDDVFTLIAPGSSKTYVYHLPQTHPAGTFWYHAHGHGSSSLQAGWMAGALIVHDRDHRRLPPDVVLLMTQVWAGVFIFLSRR
jgi:FtsP/CotA-like multicopper oxidase with cupredoxin domain